MLHTDFMPCAHNAAFEKRKGRFDCVRRDAHSLFIAHVFIGPVVYGLMLSLELSRVEVIESGFIGHNHVNALVHIAGDDLVNLFLVKVASRDEMQMASAFTDADYGSFVEPALAAIGLAADVHLIDFNCPGEFVVCFGHSSADAVAEIPRGFVADSQRALHLIRRHPLPALAKQVGRKKPLPQVQMSIVKNSGCGDAELVMA